MLTISDIGIKSTTHIQSKTSNASPGDRTITSSQRTSAIISINAGTTTSNHAEETNTMEHPTKTGGSILNPMPISHADQQAHGK